MTWRTEDECEVMRLREGNDCSENQSGGEIKGEDTQVNLRLSESVYAWRYE